MNIWINITETANHKFIVKGNDNMVFAFDSLAEIGDWLKTYMATGV